MTAGDLETLRGSQNMQSALFSYLSTVSSFRLQIAESDQLLQQTALLITPFHSPQLEISLRFGQNETQVHSKPSHVDGEGPAWVKHSLPAINLAQFVYFW